MTAADYVVIAIVVLAGMIAMGLGMVRVVLGLGGWVGAALITLYGFHWAQPFARQWIESPLLADAAAGGTLFVASLIVLTLFTHAVARRVQSSGLGALDRTLGLVVGLGLGAVVVCAAYVIIGSAMQWPADPAKRPEWVRASRSAPLVEAGAKLLMSMVPQDWRGAREKNSQANDSARAARRLMTPQPKAAAPNPRTGYDARERREMDRLIESNE